jgi:chemotaxis signal transduction protein
MKLAAQKLPFKVKMVTVESVNDIYWVKWKNIRRVTNSFKRKKSWTFWK